VLKPHQETLRWPEGVTSTRAFSARLRECACDNPVCTCGTVLVELQKSIEKLHVSTQQSLNSNTSKGLLDGLGHIRAYTVHNVFIPCRI
jgi:hypothetical protein